MEGGGAGAENGSGWSRPSESSHSSQLVGGMWRGMVNLVQIRWQLSTEYFQSRGLTTCPVSADTCTPTQSSFILSGAPSLTPFCLMPVKNTGWLSP